MTSANDGTRERDPASALRWLIADEPLVAVLCGKEVCPTSGSPALFGSPLEFIVTDGPLTPIRWGPLMSARTLDDASATTPRRASVIRSLLRSFGMLFLLPPLAVKDKTAASRLEVGGRNIASLTGDLPLLRATRSIPLGLGWVNGDFTNF
jgi:hypothetical protein